MLSQLSVVAPVAITGFRRGMVERAGKGGVHLAEGVVLSDPHPVVEVEGIVESIV